MYARLSSLIVILAIVISACGGSTTPSASAAPSTAVSSAPSTAPSEAAASHEPSPAASTGGGELNACSVVSADDYSLVLSLDSVAAQLFEADVSSCIFSNADGEPVGATSLTERGGAAAFAAWASSAGIEHVDGVGDDAVWDASTATLLVLKGDQLVGIVAGTGSDSEETRKAWSTQLGVIAAGRM